MIIEWFSVSTFDCGASSFFCPRSYSVSSRARARKWLIYVSLHKSWIIILLCRFKLPRSLGDPFSSARLRPRQEISYASILELLLLPLFERQRVVDSKLAQEKPQRGTESHVANPLIRPREGWEDVELFAGQFGRPMTLIRMGGRFFFADFDGFEKLRESGGETQCWLVWSRLRVHSLIGADFVSLDTLRTGINIFSLALTFLQRLRH